MIYRYDGLREGICQPLGERHADKQRARQPGTVCDGDTVYRRELDPRLLDRFVQDEIERLGVLPRGELRDDPAVFPVELDLRHERVRQNISPIPHERCARLIARRLYTKHYHFIFIPDPRLYSKEKTKYNRGLVERIGN